MPLSSKLRTESGKRPREWMDLTEPQKRLLERLENRSSPLYVFGPQLRTARYLHRKGFVRIAHDRSGYMSVSLFP